MTKTNRHAPTGDALAGDSTQTTRTALGSEPHTDADELASAPTVPAPSPALERAAELPVVEPSRYDVLGELGRGGIGKVARVRDRRLDRDVAVKELLDTDAADRARFLREALITARLQHPAIVPVYDAGYWPSGAPFYAMKLVSGRTLSDVLADADGLDARIAQLPRVITVAEAIAYAHSERIIHRDLKPSNVLCGAFGETIVVDWGLAKDLARSDAEPSASPTRATDAALTAVGTVMGTPAYMAPEQAGGDVDERTDIYALGSLLYQLLAGEAPFAGHRAHEILDKLGVEPPAPIADRAPDAPADLVAIANKAMAIDPAERYPTAQEMVQDLIRFQTGKLVSVHHYSRGALLRRWLRRYRAAVTVAAVLLTVLAVGAALSVYRVIDERDEARRQRAVAQAQQRVAEAARRAEADRRSELVLVQAQSALARDPTRAVAWLQTLPENASQWPQARLIALDARHRGVAQHVLRGHPGAVVPVAISPDGAWAASGGAGGGLGLWNLSAGEGRVIKVHTEGLSWYENAITAVAIAPGGDVVATASHGTGTVKLWSPDGAPIATLGEAKQRAGEASQAVPATHVAFSPDGRYLAMAGAGDAVLIRDMTTGDVRALPGHGASSATAVFSPDGAHLVTGADDGRLLIWPMSALAPTTGDDADVVLARTLRGHPAVHAIAFTPDGATLVSVGPDAIRTWRVAGGVAGPAHPVSAPVYRLAISPDGALVAAIGDKLALWPTAGGAARVLDDPEGETMAAAFTPDGRYLAAAGADARVRVWALAAGAGAVTTDVALIAAYPGHEGAVYELRTLPDGRLVTAGADAALRVWSLPDPAPTRLSGPDAKVNALAFAPGGAQLAVPYGDGNTYIWDARALASPRKLAAAPRHVADAAFAPDGRQLATACFDGGVRVYAVGEPAPAGPIPDQLLGRHRDAARHVRYAPDGAHLASVGFDGAVTLWRLADGTARTLDGHEAEVVHLAFTPDGRALVTASFDDTVRLWDVATGRGEVLGRHDGDVHHVAVSPDGSRVYSAGADGVVRMYELRTRRERVMRAHESAVSVVAVSPDGRLVASAGTDPYAVLWRPDDDGEPIRLEGHTRPLSHLAFSPDGAHLATVAADRTVRVWHLATGRHHVLARLDDVPVVVGYAPASSDGPDGADGANHPAGDTLVVGTLHGQVLLWRLDAPGTPAALRSWLGRLTTETVETVEPTSAARAPSE